ncbi:unnamed protein product [Phytophthora fragariaefolia]|uniref:Unnamed protein product n=1 Tax=Phytophthora fragariaefolia TaxID=1490495 RepID=A0A9W6Y3J1_9STRA|nr:unnamed protein product [Phytophthora fragariaefolia]
MPRQATPKSSHESNDDSAQQDADTTSRPSTPDSDEPQSVAVTVPPLGRNVFLTWNEFHEYLAEYQQRTFQVYSTRTATPIGTRNKRIKEKYTKRGLAVPPGELLPEEMGTYSKAVVCTHHGRPRSRATGMRARQPSRAINCPAQVCNKFLKISAVESETYYSTDNHFLSMWFIVDRRSH